MSTHNIGFYEEMTKSIFLLLSNIIKYAPYLFFCIKGGPHGRVGKVAVFQRS